MAEMEGERARFRLLGPLEVEGVRLLGGPKQRAVLGALLLERGRVVSSESLVRLVWGEDAGRSTIRTLHTYISRLRGLLGDAPESRGWGYAIDGETDACHFEELVAGGRHAQALTLWRGPVLADLPELSTHPEAVRLEELRLDAAERSGDLACLTALVEEHPYRESAWEALMLAFYRSGRSQEALDVYARARAALDELGLEPGPRLGDLQKRILRHELPIRTSIPAPIDPIVGREREVTEVSALLEETRLVTVTGIGGGGKTRLALEVARRALPARPVWLLELAPLSDPDRVPEEIARAVGAATDAEPLDAAAFRIGDDDALLVVDNAEHLAHACARAIETLLGAAPNLRALVTSRRPLHVQGERVYVLPPLADDAVALFAARASVPLLPEELEDAAAICAAVDGIPLAIELAAARTRVLGVREIAATLATDNVLSWPGGAGPQRHRSLRAAIDWSYQLLSPAERRAFGRLGVFAGSFDAAAAAAVGELQDPVLTIGGLADASLIVVERGIETRFRLLDTIRAYARNLPGSAVAARAHALHYLELAEAAHAAAFAPGEDAFLRQLDTNHDELRSALDWTLSGGDSQIGLRLARALTWYWGTYGHAIEGRAWLDRALAQKVPPEVRADLLGARGLVAFRLSDYEEAKPLFEQAAAGTTGGRWLHYLAATWRHEGDHERAREIAGLALDAERTADDEAGIAWTLGFLADTSLLEGDLEDAEQLYDQGMPHVRAAGDPPRVVLGYTASLADLALKRDDLELAKERAEAAMELAERLGERWHVSACRLTLAGVAQVEGDVERARQEAAAALLEAREIADRRIAGDAEALLAGLRE